MDNTTLTHHGIMGMKWGVRRYQNKDGTLTPRGQKRYNKEMEKLKAEEKVLKNRAKTQAKIDKLSSKKQEIENLRNSLSGKKSSSDQTSDNKHQIKQDTKPKKKKYIKDLTDDELRDRINRLNMEKQYRELIANEKARSEKGKSYVNDVLKDAGKKIIVENAVDVGKQVGKYFMVKFANKQLGEDAVFTNNKKKS